jgi:Kef-type K+ transport system membrane component KefB/Trk K+ transport system NAD-binding subunit
MIDISGDIFLQLGVVTIIAAVAAFVLRLIKQPQILAYVIVGVLITPVLQLVTDLTIIESMSTIGIAFLLFIVGMEMELKKLKNVALVSSLGGAIQVLIIFGFGYLISIMLGFLSLEAAYIGLIIAFSSTMIVMKLLSDKRELNTLHGRIVVGILLLQDIVAIFALSILTTINGVSLTFMGMAVLKFLSLFALAYLAGRFVFPSVFRYAARNQELLLISSLAVCFIFSLAFHYLGFSIAIGAFVAGIALGNVEYSYEIVGKIKSLRDFFSLLFFVSLGMTLSVGVITSMWVELLVLTLVVIILKPLVIMLICSLFKYTKKPSFLSSLALAQVGEFSLILAAEGLILGHISNELFSLTVIITIFSITLTSYLIKYDHWIYKVMEMPLKIFDMFTTEGLEYLPSEVKPKIILCGHNRIGYSILQKMRKVKKKVLVVDYNPEIINKMVNEGYHCVYGNVTDEEIIHKMNLRNIKILVSTVPEIQDNLLLIRKTRAVNTKAKIFVTANEIEEALRLYKAGADYVILPHFLGGEHVGDIISKHRRRRIDLKEHKKDHIKHLEERKDIGHEHPKQS